MKTQHHFPHKFSNLGLDELANGVSNINQWMRKVNKMAQQLDPMIYDSKMFKGDAFEHLIEVLIINSPVDKRINIIEYSPIPITEDTGADGIGKAHDGTIHTTQMKYSSNVRHLLDNSNDRIATFPATSAWKYDASYMTVFTTAQDVHYELKENQWNNKVKVVGYKELKSLLNDNTAFWNLYTHSLLP